MKTGIRLLAALAAAVSGQALAQTVTIGSGSAMPGGQVVIDVDFAAGADTVEGIQLNVDYNDALYSNVTVPATCDAEAIGQILSTCTPGVGTVTIQIAGVANLSSGRIARITFDIDGAAPAPSTDPLTSSGVAIGTSAGPAPGASVVNGQIDITAGPQPAYNSTPAPAAGLTMTHEATTGLSSATTVVGNGGDAGSTLNVSACSISSDPDGVFTVSAGGAGGALTVGATLDVTVECRSSTINTYNGTLSCLHDGGPAGEPSPADYALTCNVTAGPPGIYDSTPAPGSTINMTPTPVVEGSPDPVSPLTIRNAAALGEGDVTDISCVLAGDTQISENSVPATTLAPQATSLTGFTCDASTAGTYQATYTCDYDETGDMVADGSAIYTVDCEVVPPAADVSESPANGTPLAANVPAGGTAEVSVTLSEVLDEGLDAEITNCTTNNPDLVVTAPTFPYVLASGASVDVVVQATDPGTGLPVTGDLTCTYTDSDDMPGTYSWPISMAFQLVPIPTMSEWSRILLVLSLIAMGGLALRRKVNFG